MANKNLLIISALVLLTAGIFAYQILIPEQADENVNEEWVVSTIAEPLLEPALAETDPVEPEIEVLGEAEEITSAAEQQPVEQQPVEQQPAEEPVIVLPALNVSDDFVRSELLEFQAGGDLLGLLVSEELVRKFVLFTDSVSQSQSSQDIPLQAMKDKFAVKQSFDNQHFVMTAESYGRFDFLVATLIALDTEQAVTLYMQLLPLLQQAYAEIGYKEQDFNKVMLSAVDKVLSVPVPQEPLQLVRPSVVYLYADESIEALSPVDKLLFRLGPDNADALKQKLRAFRYSYMTKRD